MGGEGVQKFDGAQEEAGGGAQAASVDAVPWFAVMVLEVDEAAGELDEGFVENVLLAVGAKPDVFEDVVCGVVFARVEEAEVFQVAGVPRGGGVGGMSGEARGDLVVFAHGAGCQQTTGANPVTEQRSDWRAAGDAVG
jgi:hypothetical protein